MCSCRGLLKAIFILAAVTGGMSSSCQAQTRGGLHVGRVDLALVLAVDVSGSIVPAELHLQRSGYAEAFKSSQLMQAISSGANGSISVTYVEWGGPTSQIVLLPWRVIKTPEDAMRFAADLAALPPGRITSSEVSTSISGLLLFCSRMFGADHSIHAPRRVIDVSGNGPNNAGPPVLVARDAIIARGMTINGLAIDLSGRDDGVRTDNQLRTYFETCVIGGPGAFAVGVNNPSEMKQAILRKLIGEVIASAPILIRTSAAAGPMSMLDCLNPGQQPGR